jgi:hypothetical protein
MRGSFHSNPLRLRELRIENIGSDQPWLVFLSLTPALRPVIVLQ